MAELGVIVSSATCCVSWEIKQWDLIFSFAIGGSIYLSELHTLEIIYPKLNAWHKDGTKLILIIISNNYFNISWIWGSSIYTCSAR